MTTKPKFFFESDTTTDEGGDNTFFSTLKQAGIIKDAPFDELAMKAESEASMKTKQSQLLLVEYGTYQDNYAIHVTPTNERKNIGNDATLKKALREMVLILNDYVPYTCQVDLHLPRNDWKVKVISAVVKDGAKTWNFDTDKLEAEGIPRIMKAVEDVIMGLK